MTSCASCQVASRELHIPPSRIYISETSTNTVPNTWPTGASFGTDANGMAVKVKSRSCVFYFLFSFYSEKLLQCNRPLVQNACETLYRSLEPIRQKNPEGSWEDWVRFDQPQ